MLQKSFPWKAILFITSLKEHFQVGNSFKCMIKGINLTSLYTQLDILSFPPIAPIFPLQSWSYYGILSLYCWSHPTRMLSTHWCYTDRATNHTKISHHVSISLQIYIIEYMITSPLYTYYFISTTIRTINQSYYIKQILFIYPTIITILRL